ncbi:MAG: hypothetical protein K1X61_09930 [Chitinophagales bacterium]|nr:hypothetical protein [Chitinophagales bacterium]
MKTLTCFFCLTLTIGYPYLSNAQSSGCISGNCVDGLGTYVFSDGAEYTGQWVGGQRTGIGSYDWADGAFYYGYFLNGKLEGNGIYLGNDQAKTTYVGVFHDGKFSESRDFGTSGCLIGNCYEGVGVYLWTNDDIYIGEWHSGNRSGYGRFDWADGSFYTGYFKDGLLDGRGYYKKLDNTEMDGYFENNVFVRKASESGSAYSTQQTQPQSGANYTAVAYDDVCSLIGAVINSFPDDFKSVTGSVNDDYLALYPWHSSVYLRGSLESGLYSGLSNKNIAALWFNDLYTFTDSRKAFDAYNDLLKSFSNCPPACCKFRKSEYNVENSRYSTYYEVSEVTFGYMNDYKDMKISIELSYSESLKSWSIGLEVTNTATF